jgi:hypothetical protein
MAVIMVCTVPSTAGGRFAIVQPDGEEVGY